MKKIVFGIILLPVFLCAVSFAQGKGPVSLPEDKQSEFFWDFGKVKEGAVLKHQFIIKNSGSGTLKIANLQPSCDCLSAKISKKELLSQEAGVLEVSFETKGESGPRQQFVYVQTDNLDNPVLRYIIKVQVEE